MTSPKSTGSKSLSTRMNRRLAMLRFIPDHPSNRHRRVGALGRWAGWQVWRRGYHSLRDGADANRLVDAASDADNILFARGPEAVASRLETTASQHKPAVP
jgi:hypothetical protein